MSKVLFCSVAEIKKKCNIDGNVDDDKIVSSIEVAQDRHIRNYMGDYLYRTLQSKLSAGTIDDAGNAAYKTLWLTYVKPMVVWFTVESYLPWALFKISNGGIGRHQSETSVSATVEEMKELLKIARDNAEVYTRDFIDYVEANQDSFPEYFTIETNADRSPDRDANFSVGWVL